MDAYLLLFEVAVRHAFYAPEPCAGLRLSPTPASAAKLRRVGAVLRPTTEGVAVYVEGERLPTLQALANDTNEPLEFYLLGRNSDPDFASATAGLAESRDQVLLFDSARAQDPDAAGWRLQAAASWWCRGTSAWAPPTGARTPAGSTASIIAPLSCSVASPTPTH